MITIPKHVLDQIFAHGEEAYNLECCGALLGKNDGVSSVVEIRRLKNINTDMPTRRYNVDPFELLKVEKDAESKGLELIGIYHSHPDHPAKPSKYDLEHAFPNLSYMVLSVEEGKAKEITSWRLKSFQNREFIKEEIKVMEEKQ